MKIEALILEPHKKLASVLKRALEVEDSVSRVHTGTDTFQGKWPGLVLISSRVSIPDPILRKLAHRTDGVTLVMHWWSEDVSAHQLLTAAKDRTLVRAMSRPFNRAEIHYAILKAFVAAPQNSAPQRRAATHLHSGARRH